MPTQMAEIEMLCSLLLVLNNPFLKVGVLMTAVANIIFSVECFVGEHIELKVTLKQEICFTLWTVMLRHACVGNRLYVGVSLVKYQGAGECSR